MDLKVLSGLAKAMKRHGITNLKFGDVEIIRPLIIGEESEKATSKPKVPPYTPASEPTEEELLFMSAPKGEVKL